MRQTPPPVAEAPAAPALSQVAGTPASSRPLTSQEVRALRARRSELSDQLISATGRRAELSAELLKSPPAAQAGLQQRIAVLDARLLQLETDIAVTGRELTTGLGAPMRPPPGSLGVNAGQLTAISIVFTIFVLFPLSMSLTRLLWRRASRPVAPPVNHASEERMERVEQAVDAIAIEVERISEGQRFMTQLLSKANEVPALGVGQAPAEPIRVPQMGTVMVGAQREGGA